LVLGAMTSANAAMPVPPASGDTSVVLVGCAYGWYRGPDGQCYVGGTGPGYYGGDYYGNRGRHRGWYKEKHRGWDRDYYERYPYYGRPYGYDEGDDD
jgi:hypothetical protein